MNSLSQSYLSSRKSYRFILDSNDLECEETASYHSLQISASRPQTSSE